MCQVAVEVKAVPASTIPRKRKSFRVLLKSIPLPHSEAAEVEVEAAAGQILTTPQQKDFLRSWLKRNRAPVPHSEAVAEAVEEAVVEAESRLAPPLRRPPCCSPRLCVENPLAAPVPCSQVETAEVEVGAEAAAASLTILRHQILQTRLYWLPAPLPHREAAAVQNLTTPRQKNSLRPWLKRNPAPVPHSEVVAEAAAPNLTVLRHQNPLQERLYWLPALLPRSVAAEVGVEVEAAAVQNLTTPRQKNSLRPWLKRNPAPVPHSEVMEEAAVEAEVEAERRLRLPPCCPPCCPPHLCVETPLPAPFPRLQAETAGVEALATLATLAAAAAAPNLTAPWQKIFLQTRLYWLPALLPHSEGHTTHASSTLRKQKSHQMRHQKMIDIPQHYRIAYLIVGRLEYAR